MVNPFQRVSLRRHGAWHHVLALFILLHKIGDTLGASDVGTLRLLLEDLGFSDTDEITAIYKMLVYDALGIVLVGIFVARRLYSVCENGH